MLTFLKWGCFRIPLAVWIIVVAVLIMVSPTSWWLILLVSGCIMVPWLITALLAIKWDEEEKTRK